MVNAVVYGAPSPAAIEISFRILRRAGSGDNLRAPGNHRYEKFTYQSQLKCAEAQIGHIVDCDHKRAGRDHTADESGGVQEIRLGSLQLPAQAQLRPHELMGASDLAKQAGARACGRGAKMLLCDIAIQALIRFRA
jgi:hypothetical protein